MNKLEAEGREQIVDREGMYKTDTSGIQTDT